MQREENRSMGFWDLEAFNRALLAKQAWRIICMPENLLSRLLRARYFPNNDFLESQLGSRPSLTWRSIWGSKDLIKAGLRWRVGNGNNIDIWKDPWIPRPRTFKISSPVSVLPQDAKVSALIDPILRCWNKELVCTIFWPEETNYIFSIPLGSQLNQDLRVWHYTNNGDFSVRSAYHLAIELNEQSSTSTAVPKDWRWIWRLRLPPKVKVFLWRLCQNALPTRTALGRRRILIDNTLCPVCNNEEEDLIHTLYYCPFARQFWALSGFPYMTYYTEETNACCWLEGIKAKTDQSELALFVIGCWSIWWNRNQVTWGKETKLALELVEFASDYFKRYDSLSISMAPTQFVDRRGTSWSAPPSQYVKINFDASFSTSRNTFEIGGIARDSNGICLAWFAERKEGATSAVTAEAFAAIRAMEMVLHHGWSEILLEGDCKNLIDAIAAPSPSLHDYGPLVEDIKRLGESLVWFQPLHVYREGNRVAHLLAKLASRIDVGGSVDLVEVGNIVLEESI